MKHLNIHIDQFDRDGDIILWSIHTIVNVSDRIALIWSNGAGKSTFMKIISGEISEYTGNIENIGNITFGYLEQIHFLDVNQSVREELKNAFTEIRALEELLHKEESKMDSDPTYDQYEYYTSIIEQYRVLGWYVYENEIERVARGIGIFHLLDRSLKETSGGERTKIALARILLSKPDFLLLDEPTNFIDLKSVEWLEKYLLDTWKWGYLIVSHDREFLDETTTRTIEMLGPEGIQEYAGNYSFSMIERKKSQWIAQKKYEDQQILIESEMKLINRFRAGSRAGWAKSRERSLEKIKRLEKPKVHKNILFLFPYDKHGPELPLRIEDAFIGRKEPLFYIRDVTLTKGERIGIVGENWVGKSTLLKTILGQIRPLEWLFQLHENTKILYFSQLHETLDPNKSIVDNFTLHDMHYTPERVGGIIEQYGFEYADHQKYIHQLSGGERSRLLFALLSQSPYSWKIARIWNDQGNTNNENIHQYEKYEKSNLLILDEPTNHLDADTRESLEKSLISYPGAILFISHDRYFVNKLAQKIWVIENGELSISYGNYEDYQFKKERGLDFDMTLFDLEWEMNLVLEERLGASEARRIKERFARKRSLRNR